MIALNQSYDVIVIGGGILGCGVAQAASAAGFSTLLLEKDECGSGTSSRSSKLIHGGLRYLESLQFNLVRESLHERDLLLTNAPDLVHPLQFYIPLYPNTQRRPWQLRLGLTLYKWLSNRSTLAKFEKISAQRLQLFPELKREQLQCAYSYWDAQTDDRLLTQAVAQSAESLGAHILTQCEMLSAEKTDSGYQVQCVQQSQPKNVRGRFIVNAAGPWLNQVRNNIHPKLSPLDIDLVKGSHIVIAETVSNASPAKALYLEAPRDKRAVFVLPWKGQTMIGTTEQLYNGNPDDVTASQEEVDYLLDTFRHYFPNIKPTIIDQFAGLRVLPKSDASPFFRPRECVLHQDQAHPQLRHLLGGKLTGYRHTAEKLVEDISAQMGKQPLRANTKSILLS